MVANRVWPRRTERLELRALEPDDIPRLVQIRQAPEVGSWLLHDIVDPVEFRAEMLAAIADPREVEAVAVLGDVVVGSGGLTVRPARAQSSTRSPGAVGDVGYVMDPAYAGRGLATEIAGELLQVAFEVLGLHRVAADCFADNVGSWRVLEKIGMRREKHARSSAWHRDLGWVDEYEYAVLREEWSSRTSL